MYRVAGIPTYTLSSDAKKKVNKITDMPSNPTFSSAVKWMVNEGITTGTDPKGILYSPAMAVNRAQMAMFLWRLAGKPTISSSVQTKWKKKFKDLNVGAVNDSFKYAIYWLAETGITTGVNATGTEYDPTGAVQRVQMAAFLYRFYNNWLMKTPL
jgi:hypothetical protein